MLLQLTNESIAGFAAELARQERSAATIQKYTRDLEKLRAFAGGCIQKKEQLIAFKAHLEQKGYAPSSINAALAAVNQYLKQAGAGEWQLRFVKVQRDVFRSRERELSAKEYQRLVDQARKNKNERLELLLQTLASTGIRVSELRGITVKAARTGRARISLKGKIRVVLLPRELCRRLLAYCAARAIRQGPVFVSRSGRPLCRTNIWQMLKTLAKQARVQTKKVFPHNLRHLFAVTYYKKYRDVVRLADILGHSSVNTTRIYTTKSDREQMARLNTLHLLL